MFLVCQSQDEVSLNHERVMCGYLEPFLRFIQFPGGPTYFVIALGTAFSGPRNAIQILNPGSFLN